MGVFDVYFHGLKMEMAEAPNCLAFRMFLPPFDSSKEEINHANL